MKVLSITYLEAELPSPEPFIAPLQFHTHNDVFLIMNAVRPILQ
jgi:hypothetical protein